MAVDLTVAQLAVALRIIASESDTIPDGQTAVLTRVLAVAKAHVERDAPLAPTAVQNEAAIRAAAYAYDSDPSDERRIRSMMLHSGAAGILAPWRSLSAAVGGGDRGSGAVVHAIDR